MQLAIPHTLVAQPTLPILLVHLAEPATQANWRKTCAGLLLIADTVSTLDEVNTRRAASRS